MTLPKMLFLPCMLAMLAVGVVTAADLPVPDFSGIWRLDDQHSDSAAEIAARLRIEKKLEQPPELQPASAASTAAPAAGQASNQHARHAGGGHGMGGGMGGGHGHGSGRGKNKPRTGDGDTAIVDEPPPLLNEDALLNVQQDVKAVRVVLSDTDRLDGRLDGIARQSLNGSAIVQTQLTADGLLISMQFDAGTRLEQSWVRSADGHHLTVTERWTTPAVKQPIVFRRSYQRLDI